MEKNSKNAKATHSLAKRVAELREFSGRSSVSMAYDPLKPV